MKKIMSVIFIYIFLSTFGVSAFSDIENSWYKDSILELKDAGLVSGYGDGRFGPNTGITRAEILSIILRSAKIDVSGEDDTKCFPDVDTDKWYADYICYAAKKGITKGYSNGNFKPNGPVSVIEALAFTTGVLGLDVPAKKSGEQWYDRLINFAHDNKIIQKNAYTIHVLGKRGQVAEIITRSQEVSKGNKLNYKSSGCSIPKKLNDVNYITINNKSRSYILELPKNYNSSKVYPLVVGLHGRTNSNAMVQDYMGLLGGGWSGVPDKQVITAYPAGLGAGPYTWHEAESIDFFDAMISEISSSLCIDKSEVHIVGHSLGSYFSNKLSCVRGDVIHTMTAVASAGYNKECRGPTASLILHNAADPLVPYSDGLSALKIRKAKNLCSGDSKKIKLAGLNCEIWGQCSAGNPVAFCAEYPTYGNAPHSWPKQGANGIYEFIDMQK